MTPITKAIDRLTALEPERHSWLSPASEQIRRWRKEDEAKGLFWTSTRGGRIMNAEASAALIQAQANNDHHAERLALQALYKKKTPAGWSQSTRPLLDRLLDRVVFGATECWHWCGSTNQFGYGRMTYQNRLQCAHRLSWMAFNGPIPDGLSVLHKCDNPSCINPEHLWLGTYSDNLRDAWAKGRNKGRTGHKGNHR